MKLNKFLAIAAMTCLPLQHAFSEQIENVAVQVVDTHGGTSAALLEKMSGSMQVVAEQLFLEKDVEKIGAAQSDYARLLTEVGDRVFSGYELVDVRLTPGTRTEIVLYTRPWNAVITDPVIDLQFSGVDPATAEQLSACIPLLKERLRVTLQGASLAASDWAGGVLRKMTREEVAAVLPEFKVAVDVVQGEQPTVQVIIYPVGQLVRNLKYELRSESVPNLLLMDLKRRYAQECDKLRGLPVAYVEHHKEELEQALQEKLLAEQDVKNYNLRPQVNLTPGADLGVEIMLISPEYKIWFEGYGDIGRKNNNLSGKTHLGKFISGKDEIFGEAEVVLDEVDWVFGAGYTHYWGKSGWTYTRRTPLGENAYKLEYSLSPKWRLRAEHFSGSNRNEFGARYRIHEFLSAEYIYGGQEWYLRVIGNL